MFGFLEYLHSGHMEQNMLFLFHLHQASSLLCKRIEIDGITYIRLTVNQYANKYLDDLSAMTDHLKKRPSRQKLHRGKSEGEGKREKKCVS